VVAQQPPRREVVTSADLGARRPMPSPLAQPARPAGASEVDEPRLRALMRSQLRVALTAVAALAVLVASLPLVFAFVPGAAGARIAGVGIVWILLGVLVYPVLFAIARWYVARAERNEAHMRDSW
jgi:uncharacterized membrane protein (DUF485 family)